MITLLIKATKNYLLLSLATLPLASNAQTNLDKYVEFGIKNNLVLQQKNISLDKALYSLKEANSLFFPSVNFKADYLSGEGGRSIVFPAGDLLNPVYATLNQMTMSNAFPQISNAEINFFPKNFYDAKLRTSMPIINSDLIYNRSISKDQIKLKEYDVETYKNELSKNIRVAYYNYLSASKSVSIYESALLLATEGKRINESLVTNGKSVKAYVLRSESEVQNLLALKSKATQQSKNAQLYFNFLINTTSNSSIDTVNVLAIDENIIQQLLTAESLISNRTELLSLKQAISINQKLVKMNKAYWFPKLNGFLDLGSQASDWKYNDKSRYYLVGFQLDVPLFTAGKNNFKIKQSALDLKNQQLNNTYVTQQIQLSAEVSKNNLRTAYENYKAGIKQLEAANVYYQLIDKAYKEGLSTFIETIDSRNQLTTSSLQNVINKYQLLAALASYEREINK
jgi:outer membrane protein TolC